MPSEVLQPLCSSLFFFVTSLTLGAFLTSVFNIGIYIVSLCIIFTLTCCFNCYLSHRLIALLNVIQRNIYGVKYFVEKVMYHQIPYRFVLYARNFSRICFSTLSASLIASSLYYSLYDDTTASILSFLGVATTVFTTKYIFWGVRNVNSLVLRIIEVTAYFLMGAGLVLLIVQKLQTTAFYLICLGQVIQKIICEVWGIRGSGALLHKNDEILLRSEDIKVGFEVSKQMHGVNGLPANQFVQQVELNNIDPAENVPVNKASALNNLYNRHVSEKHFRIGHKISTMNPSGDMHRRTGCNESSENDDPANERFDLVQQHPSSHLDENAPNLHSNIFKQNNISLSDFTAQPSPIPQIEGEKTVKAVNAYDKLKAKLTDDHLKAEALGLYKKRFCCSPLKRHFLKRHSTDELLLSDQTHSMIFVNLEEKSLPSDASMVSCKSRIDTEIDNQLSTNMCLEKDFSVNECENNKGTNASDIGADNRTQSFRSKSNVEDVVNRIDLRFIYSLS